MNQYRPSGFAYIPFMVKNILIINVLLFVAKVVMANMGVSLDNILALNFGSANFRWYQFISYMFMHGDIGHIFFNMFALWMFGPHIESLMGPKRFLIFYLVCGVGAAMLHIAVEYYMLSSVGYTMQWHDSAVYFTNPMNPNDMAMLPPMVGASGSIYGILFAFGYFFPNLMIYLYFFIPMKAKYLMAILIVIELYMGFRSNDNVAHFAHLGGMLIAYLLIKLWRMKYNRY